MLPFVALIALGYLAAKKFKVDRQSIATLMLYFFEPVVMFVSVATMNYSPTYLWLPVLVFTIGCLVALLTRWLLFRAQPSYAGENAILITASCMPNGAYFGIPVVVMVLGADLLGPYMLSLLGLYFFAYTIGFYVLQRQAFSWQASLTKTVQLPILWAGVAGLALNISGQQLPPSVVEFLGNFRGGLIVMGMMMVGLALAAQPGWRLHTGFLWRALVNRWVLWLLIVGAFIYADANWLHWFNDNAIYKVLLIYTCLPMGAALTTLASANGVAPEKVAMAVLVSTLVAIVLIPLFFVKIFSVF